MIDKLDNEPQIAVDLEHQHHSFRTFQGITCLVQISSRSKDGIIDTIQLRDELCALNKVFANRKLC
jgi:exosome complex exonuclease RRP6